MKRNFIKNEAEMKRIFKSMDFEKPSADFTIAVMERISNEPVFVPFEKSPYLRLLYLLFIPVGLGIYFASEISGWISHLEIQITSINLTPAKEWFLELIDDIKIIATPASISIVLASFMLLAIFIWINSRNIVKR
jgi:hypothetical protein